MEWRWKYFAPKEVLSWSPRPREHKGSGMWHYERGNLKLQGFALDRLVMFREFIDKPLHCNHAHLRYRGFRAAKENKRIGGVPDSPHSQGIAFDLSCYDIPLAEFLTLAVMYSALHPKNLGFRAIGVYPENNFLHVDFRTFLSDKEDYMLLWNRTSKINKASIIKYSDIFPESPARTLDLLKRELALPKKWRIK